MRTHLLQLLTAVAAISVLLFASVAYAQGEDPTLEEDLVRLCEQAEGRMQDGTCFVHPSSWCGFPDSPALCEERRFDGRWMADPVLIEEVLSEGVEAETETGQTPPEPAAVEQAPTTELPATQPAHAQQGSPQYTG